MMADLLHIISQSGWLVAGGLVVLIAPLLVRIAQEVIRARVKLVEIKARAIKYGGNISAKPRSVRQAMGSTGDAGEVINTNFDILEKYYEQNLAENRLLSRSAIGVALLGFFVILIGVSLAFAGFTSVGVVSSVAGLLAEAATIMFFNQLREQARQVQEYHKKLVSTQYLMTSIALAKNLTGDRHEAEIVKIINNLLFLSNELHGSKSDHLFSELQQREQTPLLPLSTERLSLAKATPPAA